MGCMLCNAHSFTHICLSCQNSFLTPKIYKRKIHKNVEVISFYKYKDIEKLLHTKHTDLGYYIYHILANNSLKKFAKEFSYATKLASIAVDDNPKKNGYAHTAILNKQLKSKFIKPYFNILRAKNTISYSGKTKEFRILNPRNFIVNKFKEKEVILVDDIITTGLTLTQAINSMHKKQKEVLFCLTLSDVNVK